MAAARQLGDDRPGGGRNAPSRATMCAVFVFRRYAMKHRYPLLALLALTTLLGGCAHWWDDDHDHHRHRSDSHWDNGRHEGYERRDDGDRDRQERRERYDRDGRNGR